MGEILSNENKEMKNSSFENYKEIKPEQKQTTQEINDFWKEEFKKEADVVKNDMERIYTDDNGDVYRQGDNLIPNSEYEVRGYHYKTDAQGRVCSAEGKLQIRDYNRNTEKVREKEGQEYRNTDEQGHLIGHQFGGSDKLENLVPMDANLNKGDYEKMENYLADAVKAGADVYLKVEPVYDGNSTRPSEFRATYSIDGEKDVMVFRNERKAEL